MLIEANGVIDLFISIAVSRVLLFFSRVVLKVKVLYIGIHRILTVGRGRGERRELTTSATPFLPAS